MDPSFVFLPQLRPKQRIISSIHSLVRCWGVCDSEKTVVSICDLDARFPFGSAPSLLLRLRELAVPIGKIKLERDRPARDHPKSPVVDADVEAGARGKRVRERIDPMF